MEDRQVPPEIIDNLRRWGVIGNTLRGLQVFLGVLGTAAGLYVAIFPSFDPFYTKVATFAAAFCIGTIAAFNVGGKADSTRRAWRHVTVACMLYKGDPAFTLVQLVKAYEEAEGMVGDVPFHGSDGKAPTVGAASATREIPSPARATT